MAVLISLHAFSWVSDQTRSGSVDEVDGPCEKDQVGIPYIKMQQTLYISWAWHLKDSSYFLRMNFQTRLDDVVAN